MSTDNRFPTPRQLELLVKLSEECAEVIQAAAKVQLHGYVAEKNGAAYDNRGDLERELGDVFAVLGLMLEGNDVNPEMIHLQQIHKTSILRTILHFQPKPQKD